jgi:hypothetical protein
VRLITDAENGFVFCRLVDGFFDFEMVGSSSDVDVSHELLRGSFFLTGDADMVSSDQDFAFVTDLSATVGLFCLANLSIDLLVDVLSLSTRSITGPMPKNEVDLICSAKKKDNYNISSFSKMSYMSM